MPKPLAKIASLLTPKRRWAQFSLGTMLVVVTAFCVWLAVQVNRANKQREAVRLIEGWGGFVRYDDEVADDPRNYDEELHEVSSSAFHAWLRGVVGKDYVATVFFVQLPIGDRTTPGNDATYNDDRLESIARLTGLKEFDLLQNAISNSGLAHLRGMFSLQKLDMANCTVSNEGLVHLRELTKLVHLNLFNTRITDVALEHLAGLTNLHVLELGGCQISDAGLVHLEGLANLKYLSLIGTNVSDDGLSRLKRMASLELLCVGQTRVTGASIAELQKALPNCDINW